jgi:hypothetical protein
VKIPIGRGQVNKKGSTLILQGKLTENTFSFTATTWGIDTGDE